jgi:hypothetical protein
MNLKLQSLLIPLLSFHKAVKQQPLTLTRMWSLKKTDTTNWSINPTCEAFSCKILFLYQQSNIFFIIFILFFYYESNPI